MADFFFVGLAAFCLFLALFKGKNSFFVPFLAHF